MKFYFVKTPQLVKSIFQKWLWHYPRNESVLYLTFDDGPTPAVTEWVLGQLEKYKAKATFFCIGKNVVTNSSIYKKILTNGHAIGNHTHDHLNGWKTSSNTYLENTTKASHALKGMSNLFRPPYGKMTPKQATKIRESGLKIVGWDVLSADFDLEISKHKCLENVINNAENGSIIVFHDSIKAQKNLEFVLPQVLDYFSNKGYIFKKIEG